MILDVRNQTPLVAVPWRWFAAGIDYQRKMAILYLKPYMVVASLKSFWIARVTFSPLFSEGAQIYWVGGWGA